MTPMHWIAILVLYLLPVLLLFVTWCKPYPQAKWTILWGQVIVSVVFLFVYPLCAPGVVCPTPFLEWARCMSWRLGPERAP